MEASESYAKQNKRVCVLNFASATNPGGGGVHGSSAQEADNPLYNDDCIFTPKVKVFKSDIRFPKLLPEAEWWDVDVITCVAPNLRTMLLNRVNPNAGKKADTSYQELKKLHRSRIQRILR